MSDAANNALLFEEEIDVRVIDAFIKALDDRNPRLSEPMRYLMDRLVRHESFRGYIDREVEYHVKRLMSGMYPRNTPEPFNPRMDMYRKKGFSAW